MFDLTNHHFSINLKHLAKNLNLLGYPYVLSTNGKEALDKFCEPGNLIEAVIIDMSMPVMGESRVRCYGSTITNERHRRIRGNATHASFRRQP